MLRTFLSYSLNDLNSDYVILGGDLGPRGEGVGDKESVEYHFGEMMKQKRWFLEQFCELLETFFPPTTKKTSGEEEKKKKTKKKKKQKLFIVLGNSDWQVNEAVLKERTMSNDLVKVCSGLGDVFVEDDCVEFVFTAVVVASNHRKKDFERKDVDGESVPEKNQNCGFISRFNDERNEFEVLRYAVNDACERPTIANTLAALQPKMLPSSSSSSMTKVWVNHGPPHETIGDLTHRNERVGSKALKKFIAEQQPDITLHGHIHESVREHARTTATHGNEAFTSRIKNTIVASSGNDFMSDFCHGIFFQTSDIEGTLQRFEIKVSNVP